MLNKNIISKIKIDNGTKYKDEYNVYNIDNFIFTKDNIGQLHFENEDAIIKSGADIYPELYPHWQNIYMQNNKIVLILLSELCNNNKVNNIKKIPELNIDQYIQCNGINTFTNRPFSYLLHQSVKSC